MLSLPLLRGKLSAAGRLMRVMKNTNLTPLARQLRKQSTPEEKIIWYHLRSRRFQHFKFRRQFSIDKYIVDFICLAKRLIVEIDGGQHNQSSADQIRDNYLQQQKFTILKFWNNEINSNLEAVLSKIYQQLNS